MGYLIVALIVRVAGTAFLAGFVGGGVWLLGTMIAASYWFGNDTAVLLGAILGFGLGAGAAAWVVETRQEEIDIRGGWARLVAFLLLAVALTAAGLFLLGGTLLDGRGAYNPHGAHGTPEVVGAWLGSVAGAVLVPALRGFWRVAHGREP
ncbi:MAG: hypothetical protein FJ313_00875 [Gemmatimonadetes bacterium]|nr:hypothetical protein [Gemmatimonadota bacterium]